MRNFETLRKDWWRPLEEQAQNKHVQLHLVKDFVLHAASIGQDAY